jgi:hypothetical protein
MLGTRCDQVVVKQLNTAQAVHSMIGIVWQF